ncbi:MAG: hypothetical protein GY825_00200, partial [Phycisphaeraceae bacterium]|nr:hypothetical protein [Phycisphaeraceae bacterium]
MHSYLGYDPERFPPPSAEPDGGMAGLALEHLMVYGSARRLTEEDLANAV